MTKENRFNQDYEFRPSIFAAILVCAFLKNKPQEIASSLKQLLKEQGVENDLDAKVERLLVDLVDLKVLAQDEETAYRSLFDAQDLNESFPDRLKDLSKELSDDFSLKDKYYRDVCTAQFMVATGNASKPGKNTFWHNSKIEGFDISRSRDRLIKAGFIIQLPATSGSYVITDLDRKRGQRISYLVLTDSSLPRLNLNERKQRADEILDKHFAGKVGDQENQYPKEDYKTFKSWVYDRLGIEFSDNEGAFQRYVDLCTRASKLTKINSYDALRDAANAEIPDVSISDQAILRDHRNKAREVREAFDDLSKNMHLVTAHVNGFSIEEKSNLGVPDTLGSHKTVGL